MFGWAACHSRIFLWMVISAFSLIFELHSSDSHDRPALIEINTIIGQATNLSALVGNLSVRSGAPAAKRGTTLFLRGKCDSHKVKENLTCTG